MKKVLLVLAYSLITIGTAYSQIDYLKIKFSGEPSCPKIDDLTLEATKVFFDSIDVNQVITGKKEFLYDKGMLYYTRYAKWKKIEDYQEAKLYFSECYNDFHHMTSKWNLTLLYYFNEECSKAKESLNEYLMQTPEIAEELISEINLIKRECS